MDKENKKPIDLWEEWDAPLDQKETITRFTDELDKLQISILRELAIAKQMLDSAKICNNDLSQQIVHLKCTIHELKQTILNLKHEKTKEEIHQGSKPFEGMTEEQIFKWALTNVSPLLLASITNKE